MLLFINYVSDICMNAFEELGYDKTVGKLIVSNRPDLYQYQCNGALACAKKYKKSPTDIAHQVVEKLLANVVFTKLEVAGIGFINITGSDSFLCDYINQMNNDNNFGLSQATNAKK